MTTFSTAHALHIGGRDEQQDAATILHSADDVLLVLADGMGGHAGGQLASSAVVATAEKLWTDGADRRDAGAFLTRVLEAAHAEINRLGAERGINPRSTGVLVHLRGETATWTHIGDSRLYRFRGDKLLGRTHDHSVVQMLRDMGKITEEEMGNHPDQNRLTHSLGGETDPEPEIETDQIRPGDSFVLCSDGLWEMITPDEMAQAAAGNLKEVVGSLTAEANNRAGAGSDNISIVLARVDKAAAGAAVTAGGADAAAAGADAKAHSGDEEADPSDAETVVLGKAVGAAAPAGAASAASAAPKPRRSAARTSGLAFLLVTVIAAGAVAGIFQPWKSPAERTADDGKAKGTIVPVTRSPKRTESKKAAPKDTGSQQAKPQQTGPKQKGTEKTDPDKPRPGTADPDADGKKDPAALPKDGKIVSPDKKKPDAKSQRDGDIETKPGPKTGPKSGDAKPKPKVTKQIDGALGGDGAKKKKPGAEAPKSGLEQGGTDGSAAPRKDNRDSSPEKKRDGDGATTD